MDNLIERWQAGDEKAFEVLFDRYANLVFKAALLMSDNRQEAEDILQDVFTRAWNSRQTFNPDKGKLTTWLHHITVNQCLKRNQKKQHPTTSLETAREIGFELRDDSVSLEDIAQKDLRNLRLIEAVRTLNRLHKPVVVLRYFNDMSYSEIAEVLDIPLGTVKSRLNEAMRSLRTQLRKEVTHEV